MPMPVQNVVASARSAVNLNVGVDNIGFWQALWVGTGGTVKVDMVDNGQNITFLNVPNGVMLPVMVSKVYSTSNGTTANNIVGLNW